MNKKAIGKFTVEVIDFFLSIPEVMTRAFDRKEFYRYIHGMQSDNVLTTANICKFFNQLKRNGYIKTKNESNTNESVVFTNKAKLLVVDRLVQREGLGNKNCLVSFDIPEKLRSRRDSFRRSIKRMGFVQIQKSLWVSNRQIGHLVEIAAEEYKVSQFVVYLIAEVSNIDNIIVRKFLEQNQDK